MTGISTRLEVQALEIVTLTEELIHLKSELALKEEFIGMILQEQAGYDEGHASRESELLIVRRELKAAKARIAVLRPEARRYRSLRRLAHRVPLFKVLWRPLLVRAIQIRNMRAQRAVTSTD